MDYIVKRREEEKDDGVVSNVKIKVKVKEHLRFTS